MGNLLCACTKGEDSQPHLLKPKECTIVWSDPVVSPNVQAESVKDPLEIVETDITTEDEAKQLNIHTEEETKQNGTLFDSLSSPGRTWKKDVVLKSLSVTVPESFRKAGRPVYVILSIVYQDGETTSRVADLRTDPASPVDASWTFDVVLPNPASNTTRLVVSLLESRWRADKLLAQFTVDNNQNCNVPMTKSLQRVNDKSVALVESTDVSDSNFVSVDMDFDISNKSSCGVFEVKRMSADKKEVPGSIMWVSISKDMMKLVDLNQSVSQAHAIELKQSHEVVVDTTDASVFRLEAPEETISFNEIPSIHEPENYWKFCKELSAVVDL